MTKLEQLKQRAEFFPRGKIIPARVLKCMTKRFRHNVRFGADTWVIPGPDGYVCFSHYEEGNSCVKITGKWWGGSHHLDGSPYHKNGYTHWIQDYQATPERFEELVAGSCYQ